MILSRSDIHEQSDGSMWVALPPDDEQWWLAEAFANRVLDVEDRWFDTDSPVLIVDHIGQVRVVGVLPIASSASLEDGYTAVVIEDDYGALRAALLWTDDDCQPITLPSATPGGVALRVEWVRAEWT